MRLCAFPTVTAQRMKFPSEEDVEMNHIAHRTFVKSFLWAILVFGIGMWVFFAYLAYQLVAYFTG